MEINGPPFTLFQIIHHPEWRGDELMTDSQRHVHLKQLAEKHGALWFQHQLNLGRLANLRYNRDYCQTHYCTCYTINVKAYLIAIINQIMQIETDPFDYDKLRQELQYTIDN